MGSWPSRIRVLLPVSPGPVRTQWEGRHLHAGKRAHIRNQIVWHLGLGLPASFCCRSPQSVVFWLGSPSWPTQAAKLPLTSEVCRECGIITSKGPSSYQRWSWMTLGRSGLFFAGSSPRVSLPPFLVKEIQLHRHMSFWAVEEEGCLCICFPSLPLSFSTISMRIDHHLY